MGGVDALLARVRVVLRKVEGRESGRTMAGEEAPAP